MVAFEVGGGGELVGGGTGVEAQAGYGSGGAGGAGGEGAGGVAVVEAAEAVLDEPGGFVRVCGRGVLAFYGGGGGEGGEGGA